MAIIGVVQPQQTLPLAVSPGTSPGTTEAPAREADLRPIEETLPPYVVVLHNDDHNAMDHVVRALLLSVPELEVDRAVEVMLTAHENGQADVISCPLERAELYRDRLESHGLTATIRKA